MLHIHTAQHRRTHMQRAAGEARAVTETEMVARAETRTAWHAQHQTGTQLTHTAGTHTHHSAAEHTHTHSCSHSTDQTHTVAQHVATGVGGCVLHHRNMWRGGRSFLSTHGLGYAARWCYHTYQVAAGRQNDNWWCVDVEGMNGSGAMTHSTHTNLPL